MLNFLVKILSTLFDHRDSDSESGWDGSFTWLLRILQTVAAILSIIKFFD